MELSVVSQRGNDGFIYVFDKCSKLDNNIKMWRCQHKTICNGRIHTNVEGIIKKITGHTHSSSVAAVEVAKVITNIKQRAENAIEGTAVVINSCVTNITQATQGSLPNFTAMKKVVRRKRQQINMAPADPIHLHELVLPERYKTYVGEPGIEENFLLSDTVEDNCRILLFSRENWFQHLSNSTTWYVDGTFATAPNLFVQIYVIIVEKLGGVIPIIYALLPNKNRATYTHMFERIKSIQPNLNPQAIHCDFELAAIYSIQECFPEASIKGCFFHLAQNMRKTLGQMGVLHNYNNDVEFALKAKMVIALAFVPIPDLDMYVDAVANELPVELIPLLNWFEDNYIGCQNRRANERRPPLFSPEIWNLYARTIAGEDRTNNHAEAAHRRLNAELGMKLPTIWKLIDGLRKVQKGRDTYYEQLVAGQCQPLKLKKYRDADERILRIVLDDGNRDSVEYLRGLAHNYQMTQYF